MAKKSFDEKWNQLTSKYFMEYRDNKDTIDSVKPMLEKAYLIDVDITPIFSSVLSAQEIQDKIYKQLRGMYITRFHNIGKGALNRYYKQDKLIPDWMKVLHFLVAHMWKPGMNKTHVKNTTIAVSIGWLEENETDPTVIIKASRKVTEALRILKEDFDYFDIEQRYRHGISGSYHVISANWINIIHSFRLTMTDSEMSIRFKKTIRYRILSFIKDTSSKSKTKKTPLPQNISKLIDAQKHKYLTNLMLYNFKDFKRSMTWWSLITSSRYRYKFSKVALLQSFKLDMLAPEFKNNIMTLHIKADWLFDEISTFAEELKQQLFNELEIKLEIVRS